jgi:diguanylate cyclase (GGDEF)-like protein/PAS domain S-box-containing protein
MNHYSKWSKSELLAYIAVLEKKIEQTDNDFIVNFPWAGNLGQWTWYYDKNLVNFNDKKVTQIGYDPLVVGKVGFEFFTNRLHPDDYDRVMDNMRKHLAGVTPVYEVEYRIQHKDGHYLWYYDRGRVVDRTPEGKPVFLEGIVFDITKSKAIEAQLITLSEKDALTNVYNRRVLFERLTEEVERFHLDGTPFSMIMFDIDDFKQINDTFGHLVGDEVLVKLVSLINEDKRSKDHVFRYGGDEFFILLPNTDYNGASKVAKRLNTLVEETHFPKVNHVNISIGVAEYQRQDIDEFVYTIDDLMYQAKKKRKQSV